MDRNRLIQLRDLYKAGLLEDVVPFWQRHAVDRDFGGFLTFLARDGSVYGTDKPVWLMGRITWTFATLHRLVEPRSEWLALARHGYDFLTRHCFDPRGKLYFLMTRDGRPLRMRRYAFSEMFGVLGFAALAQATGEPAIRQRAIDLFNSFVKYLTTPGLVEPKVNPQTRPMKALSPLMCLINAADAMREIDAAPAYEQIIDDAIEQIFRDFVKVDDGCVLELIGPRGERLEGPDGRVMNPGHAIEAAWFIMAVAQRRGDQALIARAAQIIDICMARGWDPQYGGLLSFVDVQGQPATQLEHDMKMWWPHCEALYATLLTYHLTGDEKYARMYEQLHEWTFAHFPDPQYGEWFGYLHRDGSVSTTLKGNLWKGPFHIPRTQLYCWKLLEEMLGQDKNA